jgi:drug/metabolite transporter (DMT)-like permease
VSWLVTVAAAALLGLGFAVQQHAARLAGAPDHPVRLVARLAHRPVWLAGIAAMVAGQLLSAWALGHWRLTFVEPVLALNLVFALGVAVPLSGLWLRWPELVGAALLCGGVTAFTLAGGQHRTGPGHDSGGSWVAAAAVAGLVLLLVWRGWRRPAYPRATMVGAAAGLVFGIQDALTRHVVRLLDAARWTVLLVDWAPYALLVAAVVGIVLMQSAFGSASLRASLPAVTAAEPVAGVVLGVAVFGDPLPGTAAGLGVVAAGFAAMVTGVLLVGRARALAGPHGADRPADQPADRMGRRR